MSHLSRFGRLTVLAVVAVLLLATVQAELVRPTIIDEESFLALESRESVVGGECPAESLKRIGLCQKVLRTFLQPNPTPTTENVIPFMAKWSSSKVCQQVTAKFTSVNYEDCQSLAGHIYGAAGATLTGIVAASRKQDIQDVCVTLLSTPFPAGSNSRLLETKDASTCTLTATGGLTGLRVLMLHGMAMGGVSYKAGGPTGSQPWDGFLGLYGKYWDHTKQFEGIADVRYYATETSKRGWQVLDLQAEYCRAIERFNPHVIFTHSMGNNIIAAAISNKVGACTRISKSAGGSNIQWFSSQAPWLGSPAAGVAAAACYQKSKGLINKIKSEVFNLAGQCKVTATASMAPSFKNDISPAVQLDGMKDVARSYLSGALCGLSAKPFTVREALTKDGAGLWFISAIGTEVALVNWGKDTTETFTAPYSGNDGLVAWESCDLGGGISYQTNPASAFYVAKGSHEDGPCLIPDVVSNGPMCQPCTWYVNRVLGARSQRGLAPTKLVGAEPVSRTAAPAFAAKYPKSFLQIEDAKPLLKLRSEQTAEIAIQRARAEQAAESASIGDDLVQLEMDEQMELDEE